MLHVIPQIWASTAGARGNGDAGPTAERAPVHAPAAASRVHGAQRD